MTATHFMCAGPGSVSALVFAATRGVASGFVLAAVLLHELDRLPLAVEWKRQALQFWSAL